MAIMLKKTELEGVYLIKLDKKEDQRGYFQRLFCKKIFNKLNISKKIVQINESFSKKKGTVRGLHFQKSKSAEIKILRCVSGSLINVIVDTRRNSKTYLKHIKIKLSSKNNFMTYIPQGFANGIQTLEKNTKLVYFVSNYYNPKLEVGLNLFDPKLKIRLPLKPSVITKKDKNWKFL